MRLRVPRVPRVPRRRTCRPKLERRMPSYMYTQPPWFDPVKNMEYDNFLVFQERMCSIFQITMMMFCMFLLCLTLSMFLDTLQ